MYLFRRLRLISKSDAVNLKDLPTTSPLSLMKYDVVVSTFFGMLPPVLISGFLWLILMPIPTYLFNWHISDLSFGFICILEYPTLNEWTIGCVTHD